jgi:hypothetical protein
LTEKGRERRSSATAIAFEAAATADADRIVHSRELLLGNRPTPEICKQTFHFAAGNNDFVYIYYVFQLQAPISGDWRPDFFVLEFTIPQPVRFIM